MGGGEFWGTPKSPVVGIEPEDEVFIAVVEKSHAGFTDIHTTGFSTLGSDNFPG